MLYPNNHPIDPTNLEDIRIAFEAFLHNREVVYHGTQKHEITTLIVADTKLYEPLFDESWYCEQHPICLDYNCTPLEYFVLKGQWENHSPTVAFDNEWYQSQHQNNDESTSSLPSCKHFLTIGWRFGFNPNPIFDCAWYFELYANELSFTTNPLVHYLSTGWQQGWDPHPLFSTDWYLLQNPDVADANMNPLLHYLKHGIYEKRPSSPNINEHVFNDLYEHSKSGIISPLYRILIEHPKLPLLANFAGETLFSLDEPSKLRFYTKRQLKAFLADHEHISFDVLTSPQISVIIATYNQADLTLACLQALAQQDIGLEIIIIDNASQDETSILLGQVNGAKIIYQQDNLHFLRAVNLAAQQATGTYILLLNNDAILQKNALQHAVESIEYSDDIGAVGGKLVLPTGKLQEAGSILWDNGFSTGYGRSNNPSHANYMFRREVDFCSGAFLLIKHQLWEQLNGFDDDFAPAYFEETDFCIRLRQLGYKIIYDPRVVVLHVEFASSNVQKAKDLMLKNHKVFVNKHNLFLQKQPSAKSYHETFARFSTQYNVPPRILFIDDLLPDETLGSGFPRAKDILLTLLQLPFQVSFMPIGDSNINDWHQQVWRSFGVDLEIIQHSTDETLQSFLADRIGYYQLVFVSRPHNMRRLITACREVPAFLDSIRLIYDAEAIFAKRTILADELFYNTLGRRAKTFLLDDEISLAKLADVVVSVSDAEATTFEAYGISSCRVLGYGIATNLTTNPFYSRKDLLFVGALYYPQSPNVDSMRWFIDSILPIIYNRIPSLQLNIIGRYAPDIFDQYTDNEQINLLGKVDNIWPNYNSARIFIAPTRFGAGIPLKVQHAAAHGLPVVATELLGKQLGWSHGEEILLAKNEQDFADAIIQLYEDQNLWESISQQALRRIKQDHSPEHFTTQLQNIVAPTLL